MAGNIFVPVLLLLMSGCLETGTGSIRYPDPITTAIVSETVTVDIEIHEATGKFLLLSGKPFRNFIDDLSQTPPRIIKLTPKHGGIDMSGLRTELWAVAANQGGQVVIERPNTRLDSGTDVRVEMIYFLYRLEPCGGDLARRKLDQPGLMTPGFGCAVNRNLILSIADPGKRPSRMVPGADQPIIERLEK